MYEVWHTPTNNFMDEFESLQEAEEVIGEAVRRDGLGILAGTYIARRDENGRSHFMAEDEAILVTIKRLVAEERAQNASGQLKTG